MKFEQASIVDLLEEHFDEVLAVLDDPFSNTMEQMGPVFVFEQSSYKPEPDNAPLMPFGRCVFVWTSDSAPRLAMWVFLQGAVLGLVQKIMPRGVVVAAMIANEEDPSKPPRETYTFVGVPEENEAKFRELFARESPLAFLFRGISEINDPARVVVHAHEDNRKKNRHGHPVLPKERKLVKSKYIVLGRGEVETRWKAAPGNRGKKCPHLRRAHIRRLHDGTQVRVRACAVHGEDFEWSEHGRKYQVVSLHEER